MKRFLSVLIGAIAIFALSAPSADAQPRRGAYGHITIGPFDLGDARIVIAGVAAGGAMIGTYYAIKNTRSLRVPGDGRHFNTGAFVLTTVGCMTLAPMFAAAIVWHTEQRFLTNREAMGLGAGCIIPLIGPAIVDAHFYANPGWER